MAGDVAPRFDPSLALDGAIIARRDDGAVSRLAHEPVLVAEILRLLDPTPGGWYLDATVGLAGHAHAVLEAAGAGARLLGIDRDPRALAIAAERLRPFGDRVVLVEGDFADAARIARAEGAGPFAGIVADLGVSSLQLDDPDRGFSFAAEGPLDMRMGPRMPQTAADLLAHLSEAELTEILRKYGEERLARPIARRIVRRRAEAPLRTTAELASIAAAAYRQAGLQTRIDPATRTFQAIRIAVNRELDSLPALLADLVALLAPGGVAAIVSFHSLEDRAVKNAFRSLAKGCVCPPDLPVCGCGRAPQLRVLTSRPMRPTDAEVDRNPRARSARLRAAVRLEAPNGSAAPRTNGDV